ncbi:hypothetical protein CHCC20442_1401 [Bacillus licheniformis]|nr:hypothetical protein CHCC20442_1401 [Bacillus licheniformis]
MQSKKVHGKLLNRKEQGILQILMKTPSGQKLKLVVLLA